MVKMYEFEGQSKSLTEWARDLGIAKPTLVYRLSKYSIGDAFTMPVSEVHKRNALKKATSPAQPFSLNNPNPGTRRKNKTILRSVFEAIDPLQKYTIGYIGKLTSGSVAQAGLKNGEFPVHTFEGGKKLVLGSDVKNWILKRGYTLVDQIEAKVRPNVMKRYLKKDTQVPVAPPFKEIKVTDFPKRDVVSYVITGLAGLLVGLSIKLVCI